MHIPQRSSSCHHHWAASPVPADDGRTRCHRASLACRAPNGAQSTFFSRWSRLPTPIPPRCASYTTDGDARACSARYAVGSSVQHHLHNASSSVRQLQHRCNSCVNRPHVARVECGRSDGKRSGYREPTGRMKTLFEVETALEG